MTRIKVRFSVSQQTFKANFKESKQTFAVGFKSVQFVEGEPDVEIYEGTYDVTPKTKEQTLPTAKKYLRDDVTVKSIPFFKTSNQTGGNTVYIASEV